LRRCKSILGKINAWTPEDDEGNLLVNFKPDGGWEIKDPTKPLTLRIASAVREYYTTKKGEEKSRLKVEAGWSPNTATQYTAIPEPPAKTESAKSTALADSVGAPIPALQSATAASMAGF
jgi:hypothetical protein